MCYLAAMGTIGLRELRQDASEIVRRVEAGEEVDVTVSGRLAAHLVPPHPWRWRAWNDVAHLLQGPTDDQWEADLEVLDGTPIDPWGRPT